MADGLNLDQLRRFLDLESQYSRGDIYSPYGSATFGGPGRRDLTIDLSPFDQRLMQAQRQGQLGAAQAAGRIGGQLGGIGQLPRLNEAFGTAAGFQALRDASSAGARDEAEQAVFQRGMNLLQPSQQEELRAGREELAARGIPETSEQGRRILDDISRRQGLARENLALSAVQAGGAEASRAFGDLLATEEYGLGARGSIFGEQVARQQFPLQALMQLQQLGAPGSPPIPGLGGLSTGAGVAATRGGSTAAFEPGGLGRDLLLGGIYGLAGLGGAAIQADWF